MTDPDSSQIASEAPGAAGPVPVPVFADARPKRQVFWIIYIIVLLLVICAGTYMAWQVSGGGAKAWGPPEMPSVRRSHGRIGPPAAAPTTGPAEMTKNPLAGVGMKPLDADPDGLVPPAGAVRRWAFVRSTGDEIEMMARYAWAGTPEQVGQYYKKYLGDMGLKFLGQQTKKTAGTSTRPKASRPVRPRSVFVFHGPKGHLAVTVRQSRKNDQTVLITLNLVYPEP